MKEYPRMLSPSRRSAPPVYSASAHIANSRGLRRVLTGVVVGSVLAATGVALAQAPVAIPSAASLLAGGATATGSGVSGKVLPSSGAACFSGSPNTATDAFGDGCPGPYATFSADFRGGVSADGQGNIYVIENTEQLIRKIDAKSGIVTALNSGGTGICATANDGYGDGCPVVNFKLNGSRGGYTDPYGNLILGGYSAQMVNVVCNTVSPLCPGTPNHKQVGYVYRIAGCTNSATGAGVASVGPTPGTAGDGLVASPYGNLSGDVADWGAGSTAYTTACGNSNGGVDQPRGAIADKYGNVYIADTANIRYRVVVGPATFTLPNGTVLTNPLPAILQLDTLYHSTTAAQMYGHIYPIFGAFTSATNGSVAIPTAKGTACAGTYATGGSTLDTVGDGCPFYESTGGTSTSSTLGVGIDSEGNPVFLDQNNKAVRVLYISGPRMAAAIQAANASPSLTIHPGYLYPIVGLPGSASVGLTYTPALGTTLQPNSNGSRMAVDPNGNLYFGDYGKNSVYMFDLNTGYARNVLVTGTACATSAPNNDSAGDGCSGAIFAGTTPTSSPFSFGAAGDAMSITFDPHGNLVLADITNALIRKIDATDLAPVQVGTTQIQTINIHNAAFTTGMTATLANPSPDMSVGSVTCESAPNADSTLDCKVPVTFTPLSPGKRSAALKVATTGVATSATFPVTGIAYGSALVADIVSPAVAPVGTVTSAFGLAVDGSGNLSTTSGGNFAFISAGGPTTVLSPAPAALTQLAVDGQDDIFAVNGSSTITELVAGASASTTVSYLLPAAFTSAQINGIAVDILGNLFIADQNNKAVFEIPAGTGFETLNQVVPVLTGLSAVGDLAIDGAGNVLVADTGAGKVYRIPAALPLNPTPTIASVTTVASSVTPTHIAADAAGNLYVEDASVGTVTEYPVSGSPSVIYNALNLPTGLAVDSTGVAYEAESSLTAINKIQRNTTAYKLPAANATLAVTFSNTGNLAATGYAQNDSAEFPLTTGSSSGCGTIPSNTNGLAVGAACTTTARFTPGNNGQLVTSTTTLLAATSTIGSLTLSGQEPSGVTYTTTTGISGPSSAPYSASGTEITFTATESSANSNSQNGESLTISVASATATVYTGSCTLSSGSCAVPISGLSAGSYTITATYAGDGTYLTSNGSTTFAITQVVPTLAWTPGTTSGQYSAPVGLSVLNATATNNGAATVPGVFVYTANGNEINAASYLALGSYTLAATFYPTDSVDFATNTVSGGSFAVTQATTSAPIGATQFLVAADGTGNYSNVQAAVNAVGANGGSVYIKPGTYVGSVTVTQPNVALRGLGGDPTKVIISHSGGAFNNGQTQNQYAGEFNSSQNNGFQLPTGSSLFNGDEGSATLVVARGINTAYSSTTTTPNSFYGENLTLLNTFNTDTSTTTSTFVSGGSCTANAGTAQTYSYLFNAGVECGSQALAIWLVGDTAVMNNVYTASLQDTIYAGAISAGSAPSRQFWFRGKVTGDVDYIFGDAAAVFDHTSIYSAWHGNAANGEVTIEAQNKADQTGGSGDYLSGYVMNSNVFTSQSPNMTTLYLGRPYGTFSTWIMLNSYIDQLNTNGSGYTTGLGPSLVDATYGEYNDQVYTDPNPGSADANGVIYQCAPTASACGGNTGQNVLPVSNREASSINPGYGLFTANASNNVGMTPAQAQQFYPIAFLGKTIPLTQYNTVATWDPTAALAANVNAFVPSASPSTPNVGQSITLLMRPQTPGLGAVTNGVYTVPTGTWKLYDGSNQVATGSLDASGEATYTYAALPAGSHSFTWSYSGDSNFAGSTTSTAYAVTVNGTATTTSLSAAATSIASGQSASITATVSAASGTPTGSVSLSVDGAVNQTSPLSAGTVTFAVSGLTVGTHSITASYSGDTANNPSATTSALSIKVYGQPVGNLDLAVNASSSGSTSVPQSGSLYVSGWAADPIDGSPLTKVAVYIDGVSIGAPTLGISRPDVASGTGNSSYANSGFAIAYAVSSLSVGTHHVTVSATDSFGLTTYFQNDAFTVTTGYQSPVGNLDRAVGAATGNATVPQSDSLYVSGWAADPSGAALSSVQVRVDGAVVGTTTATGSRPDVTAYPNSGFVFTYSASTLSIGSHTVTVSATNQGGVTTYFENITINVVAAYKAPVGNFDEAVDSASGGSPVHQSNYLYMQGWAADYQANGQVASVYVVIDGNSPIAATLGQSRPDVATAYNDPNWSTTGWVLGLSAANLSVGNHTVKAFAVDHTGLVTYFNPIVITVAP